MRIKTLVFATLLALLPALASGDLMDRPGGDEPLTIKAHVYVIDIQSINSAQQSFTGSFFYSFSWSDPRLAHAGEGHKQVGLDEAWHPQMQLINRQRVFNTLFEHLDVSPGGIVTYRQRVWGDFTQPLDLREFPFDSHTFHLDFLAAMEGIDNIDFVQDPDIPSGMQAQLTLTDWELGNVSTKAIEFNPMPGVVKPIPGFRMNFFAVRDVDYYIYKVIVPLLLLVAMSWIVFWVDIKEAGTQISVSITTILTLTAYRFALSASVPNVPYMTRMDSLILSATMVTFAALVMVIVISYQRRLDRMPTAIRIQQRCRLLFPLLTGIMVAYGLYN